MDRLGYSKMLLFLFKVFVFRMNLLLLGGLLVAIVGAHTVDALKVPIREEISIPLPSIDECCMDPVNACQVKGIIKLLVFNSFIIILYF